MPAIKNAKHEAFAVRVAKGESALAAYGAVYGADETKASTRGTASVLRSKPIVSQRIDELMAEAAKEAVLEEAEVIRDLLELKRRCMELKPVRSAFGQVIPDVFEFDAKNALKALELLGKKLGMWKGEPQDHNHRGEIKLTIRDYTDGSGKP